MRCFTALVLGAMLGPAAFAQSHISIQWTRGYGGSRYFCRVESAVAAGDGDLWCICDGTDYSTKEHVVNTYRIDGRSGDLRFARQLQSRVPFSPFVWESSRHLVPTDASVAVLTNTVSGGQRQVFEGVFLTPLDANGSPGIAIPVVPKGSQLQKVLRSSDGNLLVTADQSPLSIRKLTPKGTLMWRRVLSGFDLPTAAVFPDNSVCLSGQVASSSEARPKLQMIRLDSSGRVTKQIPIDAAQGVVAAGPDGACALLYSPSFDYSGARRLASFDTNLNRQWDRAMPVDGQNGRNYALHRVSDGLLAVVLTRGSKKREATAAKFSYAGELVWREPLTEDFVDLVVGVDGAYLITMGGEIHNEAFRVAQIRFK